MTGGVGRPVGDDPERAGPEPLDIGNLPPLRVPLCGEHDLRALQAGQIPTLARLLALIRRASTSACRSPRAPGSAIERADRPDVAYSIWLNAACALACAGDLPTALRLADAPSRAAGGVPVVTLSCLAARAHVLSRLGRHEEALAAGTRQRELAERLDPPRSPRWPATTWTGRAGRRAFRRGRRPAGHRTDSDAQVSRPAARLARAAALAGSGDPDAAAAEIRLAALEPVGPGDQPWALVPRMARAQGLVALARGDRAEAGRRLAEAAAGGVA